MWQYNRKGFLSTKDHCSVWIRFREWRLIHSICFDNLLLSGKKGNGIIIHPEALLNQASGFFQKVSSP